MSVVSVGEVADFIRGITFKPTDLVSPDERDAIVCMRTKNIQNDLDTSDIIAVPTKFVRRDELFLRPGDLLISSANSWELVGKTVMVGELPYQSTAGGFIAIIRAKANRVHPRFLFHWIRDPRTQTAIRNCGRQTTNISNLSVDQFLALRLPIPPLQEQQKVAAMLDKADAVRKKRNEALKLADDFLRSVFIEMFGDPVSNPKGWPTDQMGRVCSFYAGNTLPDGEGFIAQTGGILHIKVGDMNLPGNEEIVMTAREWSEKAQGAIVAPAGAVLLPKRGGAIATNKKRILCRPCALDPNLMAVLPRPPLNIEYLYAWFGLFDLTTISSGSAVPQLNKGDLAPLTIQIPSETLLKKYSAVSTKVKAMISTYREQLEDAEVLFSALQQQAFA
jgi:type I restriction enzyme S subunit